MSTDLNCPNRVTTMRIASCFRALSATVLFVVGAQTALAQGLPSDIDIYSGVNASSVSNVLLVLDSSANWNPTITGTNCSFEDNGVANGAPTDQTSKYAIELCAMYNVIDRLPIGSGDTALFNVGLMLTNASSDSNKGAYPLKALTPLTAAGKAALKLAIRGIANTPTYKANSAQFALMMHEAYLYFKGLAPRVGNLNSFYDSSAFVGGLYDSKSLNSCGRNYIILIANGGPTSGENAIAEGLLRGLGGAAAVAPITDPSQGTSNQANWADEYARYMRAADVSNKDDVQGIITHGVYVADPSKDKSAPELRDRASIRSVASYGGGNYYEASNATVLVTALLDIFDQIQAVNSVFASASLPVSVNARGTYLNQVYMGMFRPDANANPRWRGNLKQYRFALDASNKLRLADKNGNSAINPSTGFISPSALSYWTSDSNFWENERMGTPLSSSDAPDGDVVEKGSVSQRLRTTYAASQTGRKMVTCVNCSKESVLGADASTLFNDANTAITSSLLGVSTSTERTSLINWVRGANNASEVGPTTAPAPTVRSSIHGDVLHSRPVVLNYGGTTGVVVFYGANDGQLRAVNGNQSGDGAGEELWSFVPQEHFSKLKRLRDNTPDIQLSTTPSGLGNVARDYFVDGPIGVYQKLGSGGSVERAIIYVGMRRGGRQLYAIDVTTPSAPKFLWKLTNSSSGMDRLGQTWSEPKVARIKGSSNPVVIFGGGYDPSEDVNTAGVGNAVFVVDGITGELMRRFSALSGGSAESIGRSVAADVTLVDSDFDRKVDRAYAVDLGGQVYRIDFETSAGNNDPDDWTIYKVADLSGGTSTGRKFFYGPDVVVTKNFAALMVGSGDREKPLLTATQDHFFQIFDWRTEKGAPSSTAPMQFTDLTAMGSVSQVSRTGCYMALAQGEKVVNAATSIGGQSYFGTNRPSASSAGNICSANLGVAKSYAMPLFCVASTGQVLAGGGLPPSPVAGIVSVQKADGTFQQVPFVIGAPNARNSAIEGSPVQPVISSPRQRRYWFHETQR